VRIADLNWLQLDEYLARDDRIVLPLGSTEQHAYLSLETDNILAERVSVEAAEPLAVPVLPVLPYGFTPGFAATYPGSPTLRLETLLAVVRDILDSLHGQGFRRFLLVNGHGGNVSAASLLREWLAAHVDAQGIFHSWYSGPRVWALVEAIDPDASHASWMENFPWTRLDGVAMPAEPKPPVSDKDLSVGAIGVRETLGDGSFGGAYQRPDEDVLPIWQAGVEEVRALLSDGWR
jgi:creatinine amidohydrolase